MLLCAPMSVFGPTLAVLKLDCQHLSQSQVPWLYTYLDMMTVLSFAMYLFPRRYSYAWPPGWLSSGTNGKVHRDKMSLLRARMSACHKNQHGVPCT